MAKTVLPGSFAYVQVSADLRTRIQNGDLPPGAKLPTYHELGAEWNVSDIVARQAIATLKADGLVRTKQGKGTFVSEQSQLTKVASARHRREEHIAAVQTLAQGLADGSVLDADLPAVMAALASVMAELAGRMARGTRK